MSERPAPRGVTALVSVSYDPRSDTLLVRDPHRDIETLDSCSGIAAVGYDDKGSSVSVLLYDASMTSVFDWTGSPESKSVSQMLSDEIISWLAMKTSRPGAKTEA